MGRGQGKNDFGTGAAAKEHKKNTKKSQSQQPETQSLMARLESMFGYQSIPATLLAQKQTKKANMRSRRGPMRACKNVRRKVKNKKNEITIAAGRTGYALRPRQRDRDRRRDVDEKKGEPGTTLEKKWETAVKVEEAETGRDLETEMDLDVEDEGSATMGGFGFGDALAFRPRV